MKISSLILTMILISFLISCTNKNSTKDLSIETQYIDTILFKDKINNKDVNLYTLKNNNGFTVYLTNFGARIVGIQTPDKNGKLVDVVLGFRTAQEYNNTNEPYFGPVVGPVANRIANGNFTINNIEYSLPINNGPNTLHGGPQGLHFVVWDTEVYTDSIIFSCKHLHNQEGFPGNKLIYVTYAINDKNELSIKYNATTDHDTYINLSNHAYFNMNGEGSGDILNHQLQINAIAYTPVDSTLIPTGEIQKTANTPFDFKNLKPIGKDIETDNQQLKFGKGYDHNFVLDGTKIDGLNHVGKIIGDQSGIVMNIYTTEPGLQFYSGNFMKGTVTLKNGSKDDFRTGVCLETQNFPDAPNQNNFPNSKLTKGKTYNSKTIYSFSTK